MERACATLSQEDITGVIRDVLQEEAGARLKIYAQTCMRCGACAQGCHYSLSRPEDPSCTPLSKLDRTLFRMLRARGRITPDELYGMAQIAFTECMLCGRCTHFCPVGIDIASLFGMVRRICSRLGMVPSSLQDSVNSHSSTFNPLWINKDQWLDTLLEQEQEARNKFPGLRIPLDVEGADFMYSVITPEPQFRTRLLHQVAAIFHTAQCSWTMSSTPIWDNSDMTLHVGDNAMTGRIRRTQFELARRLRVRRIVTGECGHASHSVQAQGNHWLGWKDSPVPVVHAIEFFWELLHEGTIRIPQKFEEPVTIHDPCHVVRGQGLGHKLRDVVHALCSNVVEMTPNHEYNFCCTAGGGVLGCGSSFKPARMASSICKAEQLRATGAHYVVAPCHTCHGGLGDIIKEHELEMDTLFLGDLIYKLMEKPQ